ncbi:glycosyltransferase, partial [Salmonella enterica subsp. enterica serovar 1,4,[5],12:i:-]
MAAGLTCLVPAYNEAARIGGVLDVLADHPLLDTVIVVDDGSTDGSRAAAARLAAADPRRRLIAWDDNRGAAEARTAAIRA